MAQVNLSTVESDFALPEMECSSLGINRLLVALHADDQPSRLVRSVQRARQRREQFLNSKLFSDPAWDILLELFAAQLEQTRVSIGTLTRRSGVPPTTALRWLDALSKEDLIVRKCDRLDGRRIYVSLSYKGFCALSDLFDTVPRELPL